MEPGLIVKITLTVSQLLFMIGIIVNDCKNDKEMKISFILSGLLLFNILGLWLWL